MSKALHLEGDAAWAAARELVAVGLAEEMAFSYFRFDPALAPALAARVMSEDLDAFRHAWAEAMAEMVDGLYHLRSEEAQIAQQLTLLELPNLLAALECLRISVTAERIVGLAASLENLVSPLGRPKALARVVAVRTAAAANLGDWSHAQFEAARAAIDRLLDSGQVGDAINRARALLERAQTADEAAYHCAAGDLAIAHFIFGRALQMGGAAEEAITRLEEAHVRFKRLGADAQANVAQTDKADCLTDLGRFDEAAGIYTDLIKQDEKAGRSRDVATGKFQLANVRFSQQRYSNALEMYAQARDMFQALGEPKSVATIWHQIGMACQGARQFEPSEKAYQESLSIKAQIDDRSGEARTLNQLGSLYSQMGRLEQAVRFYRQAAEAYVEVGDLRGEGLVRSNLAEKLVRLNRYDEARRELLRAIQCKQPLGLAAEPWRAFDILSDLERAVGNEEAAMDARKRAVETYMAYRRQGGASQSPLGPRLEAALQHLAALRTAQAMPPHVHAVLDALDAVLAGSRDRALADNPDLGYGNAVELLLLIESLEGQAASAP